MKAAFMPNKSAGEAETIKASYRLALQLNTAVHKASQEACLSVQKNATRSDYFDISRAFPMYFDIPRCVFCNWVA